MAVTIKVLTSTPLPGGQRMAHGSMLFDSSYPTGGETMNIESLGFKGGGDPTVLVQPSTGYVFMHNQGTAAAGKVKAYYTTNVHANAALVEVVNTTNINTINTTWLAIGPAF